jgi:hypothetical protein
MTANFRNHFILGVALIAAAGVVVSVVSRENRCEALRQVTGVSSSLVTEKGASIPISPSTKRPLPPSSARPSVLSIHDVPRFMKETITTDQARVLLERVKTEVKDIRHRATLSATILSSLCQQGHAREAWDLLESAPGLVRQKSIGALFKDDPAPITSMLARLERLSDPKDRIQAMGNLVRGRTDEILKVDFNSVSVISAQEKQALASAIASAINQDPIDRRQDPAAARRLVEKALELYQQGKIATDGMAGIFNNTHAGDAFAQWDMIGRLKHEVKPVDLEQLYGGVVQNMIKAEPDRSMTLICSNPTSKESTQVITWGIGIFYGVDPNAANAWITSHLPSLDPATGQHVINSVAGVALEKGEYDTARQWADQIVDEERKIQLLEKINAAQSPAQFPNQ